MTVSKLYADNTEPSGRLSVNIAIVFTAGAVATFLTGRPLWTRLQRWVMGTVLAGLAVHLALDSGRR